LNKVKLIIAFIIFSVSLQSCNFDSCHDVVCSNGGVCLDGKCMCPSGYEGTDCDVASSFKFPGYWIASDSSLYNFSAFYLARITISSSSPTTILLSNLRGWGSNLIFSFFANGQNISLDPASQVQSIHTLTSANGILSADGKSLSITYTYHDFGSDTTVTGNWILQ
jgi:hypothetical protein